jgi:alkylation response protein AidB-like acyl-CoA dehydrogenase
MSGVTESNSDNLLVTSRACNTKLRRLIQKLLRQELWYSMLRGKRRQARILFRMRRWQSFTPRKSRRGSAARLLSGWEVCIDLSPFFKGRLTWIGMGFVREGIAEKMWRDSKIGAIYEGTSNIQLTTIAKLLKSQYAP